MASRARPELRIERAAWNARAARELAATYHAPEAETFFAEGVACGRMQLWRVGAHSWAITEQLDAQLMIWAYAGRDACGFVRGVAKACRLCAVPTIRFYTQRRGLARLLREFEPLSLGDGFYCIRSSSGSRPGGRS